MARLPKDAGSAEQDEIASLSDTDQADPGEIVCKVAAPAGPRRRCGLAFNKTPRPLTRADLGGDYETVEATFKLLQADPKLAVTPP